MSDLITPSKNSYPLVDRDKLMRVLDNPVRWMVLKLIFTGEGIGAGDLAKMIGCSGSAAAKHLQMLVDAGICERGRSRTYRFVPRFQPPTGAPLVLDFGHCVIRLEVPPPAS
jgi:predicted transcriptional regulator